MCGRVGASVELDGSTRDDPEGHGAVLVAPVEEQLEAQADPQVRAAERDPAQERVHEPGPREPPHRRPRRADPRDDDRLGALEVAGARRDPHVRADERQRLLDADEVPGAVVHDRDAEPATRSRPGSPGGPLVEAEPVRRGSGSQAARRARASALNAASARWWSFRPRAAQVERAPGRPRERLERVLDELRRERPDPLRRGTAGR